MGPRHDVIGLQGIVEINLVFDPIKVFELKVDMHQPVENIVDTWVIALLGQELGLRVYGCFELEHGAAWSAVSR